MTASCYLLVLSREAVPDASAAALGASTGRLASWVAALRRWRLLVAVAATAEVPPGGDRIRGGLLVSATDLGAAYRLARSCPAGDGLVVTVLPVRYR